MPVSFPSFRDPFSQNHQCLTRTKDPSDLNQVRRGDLNPRYRVGRTPPHLLKANVLFDGTTPFPINGGTTSFNNQRTRGVNSTSMDMFSKGQG